MLNIYDTTRIKAGVRYGLYISCICALMVNVLMAESFDGDVPRALFTTKLQNKEPLNEVLIIENTVRKIYFFFSGKGHAG